MALSCYYVGQISEEFHQITSKDLLADLNASLERYVPCLLTLHRTRKGAFGQKMEDLLEKLDEQVSEVLEAQDTKRWSVFLLK